MDEKFKKDFQQLFDEAFQKVREGIKGDTINLFNQGFEELVLPEFEEVYKELKKMATKKDLKEVEEKLEARLDRLDRKLDIVSAKTLEHDSQLKDHSKRLKKLESHKLAA